MVYDTTRPESLDVLMYLKKDIDRNKDKKEVWVQGVDSGKNLLISNSQSVISDHLFNQLSEPNRDNSPSDQLIQICCRSSKVDAILNIFVSQPIAFNIQICYQN